MKTIHTFTLIFAVCVVSVCTFYVNGWSCRWASDDPDTYVEPTDLFEEQSRGLPDFYGKKDKATTEQAYFVCNLCECDLKSIKTLR